MLCFGPITREFLKKDTDGDYEIKPEDTELDTMFSMIFKDNDSFYSYSGTNPNGHYIPFSSALEAENTGKLIDDELYQEGGFFDKAWNLLDINQDGSLSRAEFEQTLAFMAIVGKVEELAGNLDLDAIWSAATGGGEVTKDKLGEAIRDMFGDGLRKILEEYQKPTADDAVTAAMAATTATDATNV